jgi:hypothetical protein
VSQARNRVGKRSILRIRLGHHSFVSEGHSGARFAGRFVGYSVVLFGAHSRYEKHEKMSVG